MPITFVNEVPAATAPSAELRVSRGALQIARVGVHSGGSASFPLVVPSLTAQARTRMGDVTMTSNPVSIQGSSALVCAQMSMSRGAPDFELVLRSGARLSAIDCENTWRSPVELTLEAPDSPVRLVAILDPGESLAISTAHEWQCRAIVAGITTAAIDVTDPDATLRLTETGEDCFTLVARS
jgi:hypothetical protein